MRGHISVRSRLSLGSSVGITVFLFLYRGPLPDDSNSSNTATDQRGADRQTSIQTNTVPGAPATARDDFAIETEVYRAVLEAQINRNESLQIKLVGKEAKMNAAPADFDQVKTHMESSMQSEVRRSSAPKKDLPKNDGSRLKERILPETHQLLNGMRSDLTDFQAQIRSAFGQQSSESNQFKSEVSQHRSETSQLLNQILSEVTQLRSDFTKLQTRLQCQMNTCVDTIKEQTQASHREELRELKMEMIALKVQFAQPASQAGQARHQVQNPDQAGNAARLTIENLSDSESNSSRSSSTLIAE